MSYAEYETTTAPSWLQGRWGKAWFYVSGLIKDAWTEGARLAIKSRFVATAPRDALPLLLRDYALDEPFDEPEATTRNRIARAWEFWFLAGTEDGLRAVLNAAGYGTVHFQTQRDWNVIEHPWEFWVVFAPPYPWDAASVPITVWGSAWHWGEGVRYRSPIPVRERARVNALIRRWTPAHTACVGVMAALRGTQWGAGWCWGDGTRYGGIAARWKV